MSKMRSMSQHDPWGSMYAVPDKDLSYLREPAVQAEQYHWQVKALYDGSLESRVEYEGYDKQKMIKCIGELCLINVVDKVFVWRDNEKYRHIEVR